MKYIAAHSGYLERFEVADGTGVLGIANEAGDITAYVRRPDGTRGHCYGGPVYDPPEFANCCERELPPYWPWKEDRQMRWVCDHKYDLTEAEKRVADVFARTVGWMP